jgi:hypothetical protein
MNGLVPDRSSPLGLFPGQPAPRLHNGALAAPRD